MAPSIETDDSDGCCATLDPGITEAKLAADVELLAALGNDTRYEALRYIAAAEEGVCVCELEPALGVSQSAISQALSRLYTAELVTRRKEGRWRYYEATSRAETLLNALDSLGGTDD